MKLISEIVLDLGKAAFLEGRSAHPFLRWENSESKKSVDRIVAVLENMEEEIDDLPS